eukprot:TRINITY_DN3855_c0_g1_i7.p1 TRINITY_DN3855_c0_g1~~TRINITY_DN3855_c0_g1_i7.p1  ORF type:complete len:325 (+),score=59.62 TRINITY_DN3855_c0_g1_i7:331-1305(+)
MGFTPLHYAVMARSAQLVSLLLTAGAYPFVETGVGSPMDMAFKSGLTDIVTILEQSGTKIVDLCDSVLQDILSLLPPEAVGTACCTCKRFCDVGRRVLADTHFWVRRGLSQESYVHHRRYREEAQTLRTWNNPAPPGATRHELQFVVAGSTGAEKAFADYFTLHSVPPVYNSGIALGTVFPLGPVRQFFFKQKSITIYVEADDKNKSLHPTRLHGCFILVDLTAHNALNDVSGRLNILDPEETMTNVLVGINGDFVSERAVTVDEAAMHAARLRMAYVEASIDRGTNMELAMSVMAHAMVRRLEAGDQRLRAMVAHDNEECCVM